MQKSIFIAGVLLLIGLALVTTGTFSSSPRALCKDCNVIIIGVDTLRADHVHTLGYERETTPTIDALAAKGYVFANAISPSSWTVPSFMSMFTGVYPSVHGMTNKYVTYTATTQKLSNVREISPEIGTLAEAMKKAGYATGGFTGDAGVSGSFGYKEGFDVYTDEKTFGGFANSNTHAIKWLDGLEKDQKFFMFYHGYDLHGQFPVPQHVASLYVDPAYTGPHTGSPKNEAEIREAQLVEPLVYTQDDATFWKAIYDQKIRAADDELQKFIGQLEERGLLEKTVIVVVADHGEEFYEHGGFDHGQSLYDELVHVPLIFVIPGMTDGNVISSQVSMRDVPKTLAHILGVEFHDSMQKQIAGSTDLVTYFTNPNTKGKDVYLETDYRAFTYKRGVRSADGWKFVVTQESGKEELYDLANDPKELNNVVTTNTSKASELRTKLRDHIANTLGADPDFKPSVGCLPVYKGECENGKHWAPAN